MFEWLHFNVLLFPILKLYGHMSNLISSANVKKKQLNVFQHMNYRFLYKNNRETLIIKYQLINFN